MSSVYITQETAGRLTSRVEKFNNSFLPEDGSRGVLRACEMLRSMLSCGGSRVDRAEFSPLFNSC